MEVDGRASCKKDYQSLLWMVFEELEKCWELFELAIHNVEVVRKILRKLLHLIYSRLVVKSLNCDRFP